MKAHLTPELVEAYCRGEASSELGSEIRRHLLSCDLCSQRIKACREGASSVRRLEGGIARESRGMMVREKYSRVLDKVFSCVIKESGELEEERTEVPGLLRELRNFSLNQKVLVVQNSPRFWVWALAEALLAESHELWSEDPLLAEESATLALEVAQRIRVEGFRVRLLNDLKAEAWSYVGNCRRIRSDLRAATAAFRKAEGLLADGTGDTLERARLLDLKASLLRAKRDFESAASVLAQAIECYRESSDRHLEGRALLNYSKLLRDAGRTRESIPVLERAADLLDVQREPKLYFLLKWKLLLYLTETGRGAEAQDLLPEVRALARHHANRLERLRLLWVEGLLCRSLGQSELAEEALKQVREGFVSAGIGYDVALVSLDLAGLYLESGRMAEVRRLAVETLPLFASRDVQRELLMAWQLFKEAAEQDAATLRLVGEVAARIRRSGGASASEAAV